MLTKRDEKERRKKEKKKRRRRRGKRCFFHGIFLFIYFFFLCFSWTDGYQNGIDDRAMMMTRVLRTNPAKPITTASYPRPLTRSTITDLYSLYHHHHHHHYYPPYPISRRDWLVGSVVHLGRGVAWQVQVYVDGFPRGREGEGKAVGHLGYLDHSHLLFTTIIYTSWADRRTGLFCQPILPRLFFTHFYFYTNFSLN